jgi:hypothetical protein
MLGVHGLIALQESKKDRLEAQSAGFTDLSVLRVQIPNRIPTERDLPHCIPLELVAAVAHPHLGLLASKLGGKASTNLGTP